jgi:hypothetical protein
MLPGEMAARATGWGVRVRADQLLLAQRKTAVPRWASVLLDWSAQRRIWGVHIVHTLAVGLGRTGVGLGRIPHVSGGVQRLQGLECSSSPTSGTHNPSSEGFLL